MFLKTENRTHSAEYEVNEVKGESKKGNTKVCMQGF
jgi:hypothetical protein